jgi:hypothetical protein
MSAKRKRCARSISFQTAQVVASVHAYFKELKNDGHLRGDLSSIVACATGISRAAVTRIGREPQEEDFPREGKKLKYNIPAFDGAIHFTAFVRQAIADSRAAGVTISLRDMHSKILEARDEFGEPIFKGGLTTFHERMRKVGFRMRRSKTYKQYIGERPFVLRQRGHYLTTIAALRKEGRPILYQDESWVNSCMRLASEWSFDGDQDPTQVASGDRGQRAILVGIGGKDGFVPGSFLCYRGRHEKKSADYHTEVFLKWMREMVIPSAPDRAVFVVDRASYHLTLTEETRPCPSSASKKTALNWLRTHNVEIKNPSGNTLTDAEVLARSTPILGISAHALKELCRENKPEPRYLIQNVLSRYPEKDFKLLILPVHHPELNPIEKIWSVIKNYCRKHNHGGTKSLGLIEKLVDEAVDELCTPHVWSGCVKKCREMEEFYWDQDNLDEPEDFEEEDEEDLDDSLEAEMADELS